MSIYLTELDYAYDFIANLYLLIEPDYLAVLTLYVLFYYSTSNMGFYIKFVIKTDDANVGAVAMPFYIVASYYWTPCYVAYLYNILFYLSSNFIPS